jgi:hypothetical protein
VRWNLNVVLVLFPLWPEMVNIFSCVFLPIWTSSFEKVLFHSVAHIYISLLIWGEFRFLSSLYILVISPWSDVYLVNIFPTLWLVSSV